MDQFTCQNLLRSTRLGQNFILDQNSFLCAGGELGKGKMLKLPSEIFPRHISVSVCQNTHFGQHCNTNYVTDACTGDGGAPLVCQVANQWYVFGYVVS